MEGCNGLDFEIVHVLFPFSLCFLFLYMNLPFYFLFIIFSILKILINQGFFRVEENLIFEPLFASQSVRMVLNVSDQSDIFENKSELSIE